MNVEDIFSVFGFEDFLGDMFGGRRTHRRGGPARGYDLETSVELTLGEVAKGTEKTIEFTRQDRCDECGGGGSAKGSSPGRCPACGGSGQIARGGGFFQMVSTCPQCRGTGQVITHPCRKCNGSGRVPRKRTVTIKVPAGVHEGQGIRVGGEGEPGQAGGPNGDLYCYVKVKSHEFLDRDGSNLVVVVPISITQAALGTTIEVPTLDGARQLKIPPGTQYGSVFRIKGQGLPDIRTRRTGDLLVQVAVETPTRLDEKQESLLREFAKTENRTVSPKSHGFFERLKKHFDNYK
jgi:molecular chaperone DnaJ